MYTNIELKMPSMASAHRHKDDREIDLEATSDGSDDEDSMDVNSDRLVHYIHPEGYHRR